MPIALELDILAVARGCLGRRAAGWRRAEDARQCNAICGRSSESLGPLMCLCRGDRRRQRPRPNAAVQRPPSSTSLATGQIDAQNFPPSISGEQTDRFGLHGAVSDQPIRTATAADRLEAPAGRRCGGAKDRQSDAGARRMRKSNERPPAATVDYFRYWHGLSDPDEASVAGSWI